MGPLNASRCTLEPLTTSHAREMFSLLSDPAIYEFENEPPPSEAWLRDRYAWLEGRSSPDGREVWLNWVIRLPSGELAGYVQATVRQTGVAFVAYELASQYWRMGIGSSAVEAMLEELRVTYHVRLFVAILKSANYRSMGLLRKLGFTPATPLQLTDVPVESDESLMVKQADSRGETE